MCTICSFEKDINNFYKKYSECIDCNRTRGLKRFYENKDKISNQQKIYYEKNRDRILLRKQNNRIMQFRDLVISYVELKTIKYNYTYQCMYTQLKLLIKCMYTQL